MNLPSSDNELALALGHVVIAWGTLQEILGHVFSAILCEEMSEIALAAWHCHKNDRAQREMLKATAQARLATRLDLCKYVTDLANKSNNMADFRNDLVHASYASVSQEDATVVYIPHSYYGNPRSKKLDIQFAEGGLVEALTKFRNQIIEIIKEAEEAYQCLVNPERTPLRGIRQWQYPKPT